ncbi:MAG: molybdate ABC transporter substrate-binding protein [Opitutales bacterium]|nr:molybdate ABC transporter substrate-binding protein [Opitutales bacterium]
MNDRIYRKFVYAVLLLSILLFWGCEKEKEENSRSLTLFVAASLTEVIQEAAAEYQKTNNIPIAFNFGGSGALAQQLLASPKANLFISASQKWMYSVRDKNKVDAESIAPLMTNRLVIVAPIATKFEATEAQALAYLPLNHFFIGDPNYVPAGRYAKSWLEDEILPTGDSLWDRIQDRIVPASDVRAAMTQTLTQNEGVGIIYETDYQQFREEFRIICKQPENKGQQVQYFAGIVESTKNRKLAADFLRFLRSPTCSELFVRHGFHPIENPAEPTN